MVDMLVKAVCTVEGCERVECSRGLCRHHYNQQHYAMRARRKQLVHLSRLCPSCGTWFECRMRTQKYCSAKCRKRMENRRARYPRLRGVPDNPIRVSSACFDDDSGEVMVDRLLESVPRADVPSEFFTMGDVVEQQSGKCFKCGRSIVDADGDVDVFNVTPLWITPLEQGGGKVLSNRCLVHVTCV